MSWKLSLQQILEQHNQAAARGGKAVGFATRAARQETLERGFKELRTLKHKLENVRHFKERHMLLLGHAWEAKGLSASTIQTALVYFELFQNG